MATTRPNSTANWFGPRLKTSQEVRSSSTTASVLASVMLEAHRPEAARNHQLRRVQLMNQLQSVKEKPLQGQVVRLAEQWGKGQGQSQTEILDVFHCVRPKTPRLVSHQHVHPEQPIKLSLALQPHKPSQ